MRYLSKSVDDLDLIDVVYRGAKTTVDAEYRVVDDHAESEKVEHVGEILPDCRRAVFSSTFEVESIGLQSV